jgi:hypothetical protein
MTWLRIARIAAELAIDLVRDALKERQAKRAAAPPLTWRDVEIQAKASRNAGHEPPAKPHSP